jgi:5'(3')-deoxyribonucleotidase
MRMTVFVDMDGVLADFDARFNFYIEKHAVPVKDATAWKLADRLDMDRKRANNFINAMMCEPGFWTGIEPIEDGAETLTGWLKDDFADIYIATSPWWSSPKCMQEKTDWVRRRIPKFPVKNIIMISEKHLLRGNILIDDKPEHIERWRGDNAIVFAQPWNAGVKMGLHEATGCYVWRSPSWKYVDNLMRSVFSWPEKPIK